MLGVFGLLMLFKFYNFTFTTRKLTFKKHKMWISILLLYIRFILIQVIKQIITKGSASNPLSPADPCDKVASVFR